MASYLSFQDSESLKAEIDAKTRRFVHSPKRKATITSEDIQEEKNNWHWRRSNIEDRKISNIYELKTLRNLCNIPFVLALLYPQSYVQIKHVMTMNSFFNSLFSQI